MTIGPIDLLAGPRGRRLCLEFALACRAAAEPPGIDAVRGAVHMTANALDTGTSSSMVSLSGLATAAAEMLRPVPPARVAELLDSVVLDPVTDGAALAALVRAVDSARYWQPPDGLDRLASTPEVRAALVRVASHIAESPSTAWWATALDRTTAWSVEFVWQPSGPARSKDGDSQTSATVHSVAERLADWSSRTRVAEQEAADEHLSDPNRAVSGTWWSSPPGGLTRSTRSLGAAGPAGLRLVEDEPGWERAVARPVAVPVDAEVYEITGPEAWADLCRRYPLEVTASRRGDWSHATGECCRWVIPDWSRVAKDVAGVHLTVAGYLTTAGRAVATAEGECCLLAGWTADETVWFTDEVRLGDDSVRWVRDERGSWSSG